MSPPSLPSSFGPSPPKEVPGDSARWFEEEVHPHGAQLKSFLRVSFPSVRDLDDVVQESYLKVWKAKAGQPIQFAKAFLFRVARNLALDVVRRASNSPIDAVEDLGLLQVAEDRPAALDVMAAHEKLRLLAEAIACLPPRARDLVILCKLQGLSHQEAANRLGIAVKTADEHVFRGLKRLGKELRDRGHEGLFKS